MALCQMVPGPASSQVGYLIGLRRAGWRGAFAAWAGFTLPSALVMFAFALLAPHLEGPATNAVLHGLKLVAVAVVAQAVWSMARNLCPDRPRAALALLTAALLLVISGSFVQISALLVSVNEVSMDESVKNLPFGDRVILGGRTLKVVKSTSRQIAAV